MVEYQTQAFDDAQDMLFSQLGDEDLTVVCVEHERFIPCRVCMYDTPASVPYSDKADDVARVRAVQSSGKQ